MDGRVTEFDDSFILFMKMQKESCSRLGSTNQHKLVCMTITDLLKVLAQSNFTFKTFAQENAQKIPKNSHKSCKNMPKICKNGKNA